MVVPLLGLAVIAPVALGGLQRVPGPVPPKLPRLRLSLDKLTHGLLRQAWPQPKTPAEICAARPDPTACLERRWLQVDLGELGLDGLEGTQWFSYDLGQAMRSVTPAQLLHEPAESMVVRLLISEIGSHRLVHNVNGLDEAIAILGTVAHRMDPYWSNPEGIPDYIPYAGCEPGRRYAECANAREYLGLGTWRGLNPGKHRDKDTLYRAADLAIVAWNLQKSGLLPDRTEGSTSFVHRCGGAAYGKGTYHCDGSLDLGVPDIPGAHPNKGPAAFKALTTYNPRGFYEQRPTVLVHYAPRAEGAPSPLDGIAVWTPDAVAYGGVD